jgi:hypothetical protein
VLLSDGRVVFVPSGVNTIGIFNPATNTYSTVAGVTITDIYAGGVLLPDGRVIFVPYSNITSTVGIFNPALSGAASFTTVSGAPGGYPYCGGVLLPDGRVVFVPEAATTIGLYLTNTPAPKEFCLHPCFNKM